MFKVFIIFVIAFVVHVNSHGRLMKPVSRSSIWRIPEFKSLNPPINYNDMQLFCGGIHQKETVGGNCGVCGDPYSDPTPRENEFGGRFYKGIIVGRYTAGSIIDIEVQLTQSHLGFMEYRLCTNPEAGETQECFNQNVLQRADGQGSKVIVDRGTGWYKDQFRLPEGVTCDHCSFQWNYRAGNDWGPCPDGTEKRGCGPQETFRGCADIVITQNVETNLLNLLVH